MLTMRLFVSTVMSNVQSSAVSSGMHLHIYFLRLQQLYILQLERFAN